MSQGAIENTQNSPIKKTKWAQSKNTKYHSSPKLHIVPNCFFQMASIKHYLYYNFSPEKQKHLFLLRLLQNVDNQLSFGRTKRTIQLFCLSYFPQEGAINFLNMLTLFIFS